MIIASAFAMIVAGTMAEPIHYRCTVLGNTELLADKLDLTIAPHPEHGHIWSMRSDSDWLPSFEKRRDVVVSRHDVRLAGQMFSHGTSDAFRNEVTIGDTEYTISVKPVQESTHIPNNDAAIVISTLKTFVIVGHVEEMADLNAGLCTLKSKDKQ